MASRNKHVEATVEACLAAIDNIIGGHTVGLPSPEARRICDEQLEEAASSRTASLFFAFYSLEDRDWDCDELPTGVRGKYGDKLLGEQLSLRQLTLHGRTTAFAENLGWKGNVANVKLSRDPRFRRLTQILSESSAVERRAIALYLAGRFADSRQEHRPLPPVGPDVLTFARAKRLFMTLVSIPTEGHVPQFLVAALLSVHRARYGLQVRTHHPHAADKYDATAGDIEELVDEEIVRAYEVTVRPDWKNRISNFRDKMDAHGLAKYVIIAANVNDDEELAESASLITLLEPYGRDIAVIDISDLLNVMAAELSASELRTAVNEAYDMTSQPRLCGRHDIMKRFRDVVDAWLDTKGNH